MIFFSCDLSNRTSPSKRSKSRPLLWPGGKSEIDFNIHHGPIRHQDPFPIDESLQNRVNQLLGEVGNDIVIGSLQPTPRLNIRQSQYAQQTTTAAATTFSTTPPTNIHVISSHIKEKEVIKESKKHVYEMPYASKKEDNNKYSDISSIIEDEPSGMDFRPQLRSIKNDRIVSVKQDRQPIQVMQITNKKAVLKEIINQSDIDDDNSYESI